MESKSDCCGWVTRGIAWNSMRIKKEEQTTNIKRSRQGDEKARIRRWKVAKPTWLEIMVERRKITAAKGNAVCFISIQAYCKIVELNFISQQAQNII